MSWGGRHQGNVIALEQDTSEGFSRLVLERHLRRPVDGDVHEHVESDQLALNRRVLLIIQPDLKRGLVLEVPEDLVLQKGGSRG